MSDNANVSVPVEVIGEPPTVISDEPVAATDVTVPAPAGADHVPSARRKFVVPPPEAGTIPGLEAVNEFAVREIVPLVVIGDPVILMAEFADDTPTLVTVPAPLSVAQETTDPSVVRNFPELPVCVGTNAFIEPDAVV